ncbi:MAG: UDP-N-acetylmuramoyl-L-alanine--D-glutamate ligase [Arenicella sp.]|nr:UDP-N-acetylmuramoyl-L-alanine--D-glutamate ligase [Arenicella sp.]
MKLQAYNSAQSILEQYRAGTVIGLGETGFSVVRYLLSRGLDVTVLDSRDQPPKAGQLAEQFPRVQTHFGEFDFANLNEAGLIIASPGVALSEPVLRQALQAGAHIIGDIELFIEENQAPLIAITGSNGKSTVTTLVGEMLKSADKNPLVAGNIGAPVLDALTDSAEYDIAVLELSSFQLETTTRMPAQSAAILNVSADHMDRYDSMGDYLLAKARILRGAEVAVLPRHDEQLKQISQTNRMLSFALDEPANDAEFGVKRVSNSRWLMKGSERLVKLRDIQLIGLHNVKNVLAAFALVDFLHLPLKKLVKAVKCFMGLPHRMQTVAVAGEVSWVNDSKATNIGATVTALRNLECEVVWIAGGQGKGADFKGLAEAISPRIRLLILLGEDAAKIEQALTGLVAIKRVSSMAAAVELAGSIATPGCIVLLSPACASFDMYRNFEHRGDDFSTCVENHIQRGAA